MIKEEEAPPPVMGAASWVAFRAAYRAAPMGGVIGGIIGATAPPAVPKVATPQRVRVSQGVSQGLADSQGYARSIRRWLARLVFRERWFCRLLSAKTEPSRTFTWSVGIRC